MRVSGHFFTICSAQAEPFGEWNCIRARGILPEPAAPSRSQPITRVHLHSLAANALLLPPYLSSRFPRRNTQPVDYRSGLCSSTIPCPQIPHRSHLREVHHQNVRRSRILHRVSLSMLGVLFRPSGESCSKSNGDYSNAVVGGARDPKNDDEGCKLDCLSPLVR